MGDCDSNPLDGGGNTNSIFIIISDPPLPPHPMHIDWYIHNSTIMIPNLLEYQNDHIINYHMDPWHISF